MRIYKRPEICKVVADINEPICLYTSSWLHSSPCYFGGGTAQQLPELGNDAVRFQCNFYHDCSDIEVAHETNDQWIIVELSSPLDERITDFIVDSHYPGQLDGIEIGNDRKRVRFDMAYHSNKYDENIGIGDVYFHIVTPGISDTAVIKSIAEAFAGSVTNIYCYDKMYTR